MRIPKIWIAFFSQRSFAENFSTDFGSHNILNHECGTEVIRSWYKIGVSKKPKLAFLKLAKISVHFVPESTMNLFRMSPNPNPCLVKSPYHYYCPIETLILPITAPTDQCEFWILAVTVCLFIDAARFSQQTPGVRTTDDDTISANLTKEEKGKADL